MRLVSLLESIPSWDTYMYFGDRVTFWDTSVKLTWYQNESTNPCKVLASTKVWDISREMHICMLQNIQPNKNTLLVFSWSFCQYFKTLEVFGGSNWVRQIITGPRGANGPQQWSDTFVSSRRKAILTLGITCLCSNSLKYIYLPSKERVITNILCHLRKSCFNYFDKVKLIYGFLFSKVYKQKSKVLKYLMVFAWRSWVVGGSSWVTWLDANNESAVQPSYFKWRFQLTDVEDQMLRLQHSNTQNL